MHYHPTTAAVQQAGQNQDMKHDLTMNKNKDSGHKGLKRDTTPTQHASPAKGAKGGAPYRDLWQAVRNSGHKALTPKPDNKCRTMNSETQLQEPTSSSKQKPTARNRKHTTGCKQQERNLGPWVQQSCL